MPSTMTTPLDFTAPTPPAPFTAAPPGVFVFGVTLFFWKALINHTSDRVLPATQPLKTVPRYDTDNRDCCHTLWKNTLRPGRNQVMALT